MNLKQRLADFIVKRRESALLWQVFQESTALSRLARMNFQRALEIRGIALTDEVMQQARSAAAADRNLTVGGFLDRKLRKSRPSRLSWGKR